MTHRSVEDEDRYLVMQKIHELKKKKGGEIQWLRIVILVVAI